MMRKPLTTDHEENNFLTKIENDEEQVEFDQVLWNVLLTDDDSSELSNVEIKEVLKLHKYFAHRNGKKLWENLFQLVGKLKEKKR